MARKVREWVEAWQQVGGDAAFLGAHPGPFLLVLQTQAPEASADALSFQTIRLGPASQLALDTLDLTAHQVAKQAGSNAFAMMITVGRAANNDVVLDVPNVSKFHGFFVQRDGRWHLQDADSSNGTSIAGERLPPKVPTPLEDDCKLQFATVKCRFLTGERFVELLAQESRRA